MFFKSKKKVCDPAPSETIDLKRSDGRSLDLTRFSGLKDYVAKVNEERKVEEDAKVQTFSDVDMDEPINIKRSDGVNYNIIKVFKAQSDSRGASMRLTESVDQQSPLRRFSLGIMDMQGILSSSQKKSVSSPIPREQASSSYHPSSIRIIHMSDTMNFLMRSAASSNNFLPGGDILVHSGNFSFNGTEEEFSQFDEWLASVADKYHYRVVCLGQGDVRQFGSDWEEIRTKLPHATHVLCHTEATILGLRIWGCPWHWGHDANYSLRAGAPDSNRYGDIPEGINVLVSHGPAYGRLDKVYAADGSKEERWGCRELQEAVKRVKPGLHLHGHAWDSRGFVPAFAHSPLSVNSVMADKDGTVLYGCPHVVKATQKYSCTDISLTGGGGSSGSSQKITNWDFAIASLM